MFERYTEKARRVIFFARYYASEPGSRTIQPEHVLLGLLRENKDLTTRIARGNVSADVIRKRIEERAPRGARIPTSVDLPVSEECARVLAYAAEEADGLGHRRVGTEHLLLGLLRESESFAGEILREAGLEVAALREELRRGPINSIVPPSAP